MKKSNILFLFIGFVLGFVIGNIFSRKSTTNIDKDLEDKINNSEDKFSIEKVKDQISDTVKKISDAFEAGKKSVEEENANE